LVAITVAADRNVQPFDEDTHCMRIGSVVVGSRMDGALAPVPDPRPHSRADIAGRRWKPAIQCPLSPVVVPRVKPKIHHRPTCHKTVFQSPVIDGPSRCSAPYPRSGSSAATPSVAGSWRGGGSCRAEDTLGGNRWTDEPQAAAAPGTHTDDNVTARMSPLAEEGEKRNIVTSSRSVPLIR
jgi:hypothetical protein